MDGAKNRAPKLPSSTEQSLLQAQQQAGQGIPPVSNVLPVRAWYQQPCMLGIDEAGRGPVLGPMVYACALAPLAYGDELAKKEYADSKTLSEPERRRLFAALSADDRCAYAAALLPAADISAQMLAPRRVSLNAVAEAATISLIQGVIDAGADLQQVFVDTVGDADRYRERLSAVFPGLAFTVAPKADALYPLVSAASIAAKVLRDAALEHEAAAMPGGGGGPVGNGYPSDPCTQAWLAAAADRLFGFPPLVRFSWETAARVMEERCVPVTWACEAAGGNGGAASGGGQQTLGCFRAPSDNSGESSGLGRHAYFRLRRLQRVAAF